MHLKGIARIIISIVLGGFFSWIALALLYQLFSAGAPTAFNGLPFFYNSIEYIIGWLVSSTLCAFLFYDTLPGTRIRRAKTKTDPSSARPYHQTRIADVDAKEKKGG